MRPRTRDAIINEAIAQATVRGLENISIGGLATALGMSKSGVFAHFRSLEALQLSVLEVAIARFIEQVVRPALEEAQPIARLNKLVAGQLDWIAGASDAPGCLFTGAMQELDDRPGLLRDRLLAAQTAWRSLLEQAAAAAMREGDLPDGDVRLLVFQITGIALAYQHAAHFMGDPDARACADAAFGRLHG